MGRNAKIFIVSFSLMVLGLGIRVALGAYEKHKVALLFEKIQNHEECANAENRMACAHDRFLSTASFISNPALGQDFLAKVYRLEKISNPERESSIKEQYFIHVADLFIRALRKKQSSLSVWLPHAFENSLDLKMAVTFHQGMVQFLDRNQQNREVASLNPDFNSELQELSDLIEHFH